jgi:hypothetical protein
MSSWLRISLDFCGLGAEPIPKDCDTPSREPLRDTDAHQHVKRRAATDLESCGVGGRFLSELVPPAGRCVFLGFFRYAPEP